MTEIIQSNSIRGDRLHEIMGMTIQEILRDIRPLFGPDATDAFITKNDVAYYTRDGMEVMESLHFDNELANYVHHILFQAAYDQGKKKGDGTTTLELLYCYLYGAARWMLTRTDEELNDLQGGLNAVRERWNTMIKTIVDQLKAHASTMNEDDLVNMLYTCTQDAELSAKLYSELKDALMSGAYIVPRVSDITDDFRVTTFNRPVFKATRQFALRTAPTEGKITDVAGFYCAGSLDIAHYETLLGLCTAYLGYGPDPDNQTILRPNIVIYCHGVTDRTRKTLKELIEFIRANYVDVNDFNNILIYTLDDYRIFEREELSDIISILVDEPGPSGLTQPLTFETLLYRSFFHRASPLMLNDTPLPYVEDLETFDMGTDLIEKTKTLQRILYSIEIDPEEGIAIDRTFGVNTVKRYNELKKAIEEEKSDIRKVSLNRRMRRTFGMFIDIEVGSTLMKDSQRKFELILDAVLSASEAAREGVLMGNSLLHVMQIINACWPDRKAGDCAEILYGAIADTFTDLVRHRGPNAAAKVIEKLNCVTDYYLPDFNLRHYDLWPNINDERTNEVLVIPVGEKTVTIHQDIVEPVGIITAILEKSVLPIELAKTEVFHITGNRGYMNNIIEPLSEDRYIS